MIRKMFSSRVLTWCLDVKSSFLLIISSCENLNWLLNPERRRQKNPSGQFQKRKRRSGSKRKEQKGRKEGPHLWSCVVLSQAGLTRRLQLPLPLALSGRPLPLNETFFFFVETMVAPRPCLLALSFLPSPLARVGV